MEYTKFIEQYKTLKNKEDFVKKRIKTTYVPYVDKLTNAMGIAENTTHMQVNDKKIYKRNTPGQYFFTIMKMIEMYTDLEFSTSEYVTVYDELNRNDIMTEIFNNIPEREITEFRTLVDMCVNDTYENERDISSLLENKLEAVNIVIEQIRDAFGDVLKDIDVKELVKNLPQNTNDQMLNVAKFNETKEDK